MLGTGAVSHDVQLDMESLIDGTSKVPGWVTHGIVDRASLPRPVESGKAEQMDPCHHGESSCSVSGVDIIHKQGEVACLRCFLYTLHARLSGRLSAALKDR
jgi:hypothetical protein